MLSSTCIALQHFVVASLSLHCTQSRPTSVATPDKIGGVKLHFGNQGVGYELLVQ